MRVEIKPEIIRWACERSGLELDDLARSFPKIREWESGSKRPTLKQLESFANTTHTPFGYLFLSSPPVEEIPIPDLRTMRNARVRRPTPDLLETIYLCQQRQDWYRDFARSMRQDKLDFVGSVSVRSNVERTAEAIRTRLGFDLADRRRTPTWTEALRTFIESADRIGILVMVSGVVGNNNRRKLDPEEFRGFALSDDLAPLVFINGSDSKSAQMFTLAHELAHIWLGKTALSNETPDSKPTQLIEDWCNKVAGELLVPLKAIRDEYHASAPIDQEMNRLARVFKVSTLVVLRRIHDVGGLSVSEYHRRYQEELSRLLNLPIGAGGNFYLTQAARVSKRFARALVVSTLEGQTLHRDAFRLLGFSKLSTFRELGHSLGVG